MRVLSATAAVILVTLAAGIEAGTTNPRDIGAGNKFFETFDSVNCGVRRRVVEIDNENDSGKLNNLVRSVRSRLKDCGRESSSILRTHAQANWKCS